MSGRNAALVNGALIALGAAGLFDVAVVHLALGLHRALPGPGSDAAELVLLAASGAMLVIGLVRERAARRR